MCILLLVLNPELLYIYSHINHGGQVLERLAETLREQHRLAGLTQQELADKIGTKKIYIPKLENGHADVQLSTLLRIFAGLCMRISLTVL